VFDFLFSLSSFEEFKQLMVGHNSSDQAAKAVGGGGSFDFCISGHKL